MNAINLERRMSIESLLWGFDTDICPQGDQGFENGGAPLSVSVHPLLCWMSTIVFSVCAMPGEAIRPILRMVSSGVRLLMP